MTLRKVTEGLEMEDFIETRIEQPGLDQRLRKETFDGRLQGPEHWFREDINWYRLNVGYTNPLNFGEVHAELQLIKDEMRVRGNSSPLYQAVKGKHLVFYGVGVGDTEIVFVDWLVRESKKDISVTGIDVNRNFIRNFVVALRNRTFEPDQPTIYFRGYHALFDQLKQDDLGSHANAHICLGGTFGNFYDQDATAQMFSKLAKPNDTLILGVQLDTNIDYLFEKYRNNPLFPDFILNYVPKEEREKPEWSLDREKGLITAHHKGVEVFRTTKYDPERLRKLVTFHGFEFVDQVIDGHSNSCLQVYERIKP